MPSPAASIKVQQANALATERLQQTLANLKWPLLDSNSNAQYSCLVQPASKVNAATRQVLLDLLESNMKQMYINSSFGWDSAEKRKELFHPEARFLLIYPPSSTNNAVPCAFAMFRFEKDSDRDGKSIAMLYCWEMQVHTAHQGNRLGRCMFQALQTIGTMASMQMIMLTVFQANAAAQRFYKSMGMCRDASTPCEELDGENVDYIILSKSLDV